MSFLRTSLFTWSSLPKASALLLGSVGLSACLNSSEPAIIPVPDGPDVVTFTQANLYPEGLELDTNNGRFLVSSLTTGTIGQVLGDGSYFPFATDTSLVSSVGLQIDGLRNRLLVAVSDPGYNKTRTKAATQGKLAALVSFGSTGQRLSYTNLGSLRPNLSHFANDLAVDIDGNTYVTDSFAPIIYKVNASGVASVFLEDQRLAAPAGQFGLNGIEIHPDGYLLVAKTDDGSLFKVPLASPKDFVKVGISENLIGIDGIQLQDVNTLYVAVNAQSKVYRLATTKNWTDASVSGTFTTPPQYPTTMARRTANETYVLYSNINALQAGQTPPVSSYSTAKLKF
ncbi:hypothetical protein [Hymenobacter metallicola]|uniref:Gluconolaconase n=1 Tax=Hymenobacter metallicola TaxID=2563114 RepID=A0A4Z0QD76_9BACT|nr:hypothetical protein [Hymenobacter metallicola]TGE27990.1 hypothetical protein E5K02_00565 [Hymenobacter metallicola]